METGLARREATDFLEDFGVGVLHHALAVARRGVGHDDAVDGAVVEGQDVQVQQLVGMCQKSDSAWWGQAHSGRVGALTAA